MTSISNFKVLERNSIYVSGNNAEYAKYSYLGDTRTDMGKYVLLDSNGLIWTLNAVYSIDESSELDPFLITIKTFQILN